RPPTFCGEFLWAFIRPPRAEYRAIEVRYEIFCRLIVFLADLNFGRRERLAGSSSASLLFLRFPPPDGWLFDGQCSAIMELLKSFKIDSVSRLQPTPPRSIAPDKPVADAVALMRQERIGCLVVLENRELLGILTERDVMRRVLGARRPLT